MNFSKLPMILTLFFCMHTLVPAAASDDDNSFWNDGWRTGQESRMITEEAPDLRLHNQLLEEAFHASPAKKTPYDRLQANCKPIRVQAGAPTKKAIVQDFFMCSKCSYTTGSPRLFKKHNEAHESYYCSAPGCSHASSNLQRLIEHTRIYHGQ